VSAKGGNSTWCPVAIIVRVFAFCGGDLFQPVKKTASFHLKWEDAALFDKDQ